jgi:hypothetical protein
MMIRINLLLLITDLYHVHHAVTHAFLAKSHLFYSKPLLFKIFHSPWMIGNR